MKNNVLFTVTNLDIIPKLKEKGITYFVYPLSFFCVGIPNTFTIEEITEDNAYLFINRILNSHDISVLDDLLHHLPKNIKGIIFDDLGIIDICKDLNLHKILYLSHFNTNYESINYFFDYVDDVIVSTDITFDEIKEITKKVKRKVSLFTFGLVPALYSRRTLLKSHSKHFNIPYENQKSLTVKDKRFISIENEYGMMMYHYPYYDGRRLLDLDASYYFYYPILLSDEKVLNVCDNDFQGIETDEGFLNQKTIYKIKNN